jgi:hypothetical protein
MYRLRLFLVLVLFGVMLVACGSNTSSDESTAPAAAEAPADSADADTSADSESAAEAPAESSDADASASDEWSGASFNRNLEALDSYTATFTYEQGEGDAKKAWSWQQRVIREPRAVEMFTNDVGTDSTAGSYHIVQIGDKMYSVTSELNQCMLIVNQPDEQGLQPDSILSGLPFSMKKEGAGPDKFGRATDQYSYTGDDVDGSSYQATAIVDRADGFAYNYDVVGVQKNAEVNEPFRWTYELKEVNSVASIEIPKGCEDVSAGTKWPVPEGAVMTMQTNEMVSFTSTQPLKEVADFYADAMPAAGYTAADGSMTMDNTVMANYSKDGANVSVIMTFQDGKTTVIITTQGQ